LKPNCAGIAGVALIVGMIVYAPIVRGAQDELGYGSRAAATLFRGVHNVVFSIREIPHHYRLTQDDQTPWESATRGVLKGFRHMVLRATVGVFEIATFPIPQKAYLEPDLFI
jgi:putative exosortase-associated protein (TIGR04073 family)